MKLNVLEFVTNLVIWIVECNSFAWLLACDSTLAVRNTNCVGLYSHMVCICMATCYPSVFKNSSASLPH